MITTEEKNSSLGRFAFLFSVAVRLCSLCSLCATLHALFVYKEYPYMYFVRKERKKSVHLFGKQFILRTEWRLAVLSGLQWMVAEE